MPFSLKPHYPGGVTKSNRGHDKHSRIKSLCTFRLIDREQCQKLIPLKAQITWEASEEPTLQDHQLRAVIGPDYNADDATTLHTLHTHHTFLPADPREFLTGANFAIPGSRVPYKIFVRLTTRNESGSEAATVTRPV